MRLYVLLSIEFLTDVDDKTQAMFNQFLEQNSWKQQRIKTNWLSCFSDDIRANSAINSSLETIEKATKYASIHDYNAALAVSYNVPYFWSCNQKTDNSKLADFIAI